MWQEKRVGTGVAMTASANSSGRFHEVKSFHDREVRWAWSFRELVFSKFKRVMYGIGPSSLYEVIPGKSSWFCRRVAGDYLSHSGIISTMAASGGNLPVNTVRSQIGG